MYVRMVFLEKKVIVMESILVDVRVALDSIMMENHNHQGSIPITHTPGAQLSAPVPLEASESESLPEEKFYSSILEQAHEEDTSGNGVTAEKALESFAESLDAPDSSVGPNLDSMTRNELFSLAEKKGLRVKKNMNRAELISVLRRSDMPQNELSSTGAENVSGSTGNNLQAGASLDGIVSVDLGKNGASLEESM